MALLLVALAACAPVVAFANDVYGEGVPVVASVLGTEIRTNDATELRYLVLRELTDRYADRQGIKVQKNEIAEYVNAVSRAMARDREAREAERDRLQQKLQSGDLSDAERDTLSSRLGLLNELLEDAVPGSEDSAKASPEEQAAREQIAAAFIRQWKINRALYRQYGGRVIFQQGVPEPLDAYRLFLEERERQGDFDIRDPSLEEAFWQYYRTDTIHSFYPPGSAEERQVFERPFWTTQSSE